MENIKDFVLRLGDNSLILGHRLAEYSSKGPYLEEDLAISNIALDHIGQAEYLLRYAGQLEGNGRSEDDLAYRRPENEYLNVQLVEQPNTDFASIMVRQYFIDLYNFFLYDFLKESTDENLAALATKAIKEVKYHLLRSSEWVIRLGRGTEDSHSRVQQAADDLWMYTGELFELMESTRELIENNTIPDPSQIKVLWDNHVDDTFEKANINRPQNDYMITGSGSGIHSEHLGHILSEMQYLQRAYPDAKW
jgi:ring-1,2-phenylacetyl-CoA epoxidase subunit PaaC